MIARPFRGLALFVATALLAGAALGATLTASAVAANARADATHAAGTLMVRVITPATPSAVTTAAALLRDIPGVSSAKPMDAARAADLLGAWGGAPVDPAALPALHLIEAHRDAGAAPNAAITEALQSAGIRAELYDAGPSADDGAQAASVAFSAGGLAAAILFVVLLLLYRAAAQAAARTLTVLADLGAARRATLALFGRNAAEFAFGAGGLAAAICAFVAPGVLTGLGEHLSLETMLNRIGAYDAAFALLAPLATALAATIGARLGAARAYDQADRLG